MSTNGRPWYAALRMPLALGWPQLRAGFVLFHVLTVVVLSLPRPGELDKREAWQKPRVQRNFATGTRWLRGVGVPLGDDTLQELTWDAAQGYLGALQVAVKPFAPYAHAAGFRQGWRMFLTGSRDASREHIEIFERGRWRTLYVRGSGVERWLGRELDYHRFRKLCGFATKGHDHEWQAFGRWLARRAAREFPDAVRLRLWAEVFEVPTIDEWRAGTRPLGKRDRQVTVDLGALR